MNRALTSHYSKSSLFLRSSPRFLFNYIAVKMTYTHIDVRLCVQAIRAYFIFLFLPMFFVIFVICATSRSNMFVFRSPLLCSLFHPSTICKFCKSAKVFLTPFRGHNFSPKLTPFCLQTSKRKVAKGAFSSSGTPLMLSFLFLPNFHTQNQMSLP